MLTRRRMAIASIVLLFVLLFAVVVAVRRARREEGAEEAPAVVQPSPTASVSTPEAEASPEPEPGSTPTPGAVDGETPALIKSITTLIDDVGGRVDWSHKHGMIAFSMRGEDDYYDVYTMNSDGSGQVCLTCDNPQVPQRHNDQPAWHPLGEWIVIQVADPELDVPPFLKHREMQLTQGGAGFNNNLWLVNRDGTKFYQLTQVESGDAVLHPHFSHDGTKLLWAARGRFEGFEGKVWMIKIADFSFDEDGIPRLTNVRTYRPGGTENTFYEGHGFTPDDEKVVFSASIGREGHFDMDEWLMNVETQELTQLTDSEKVWDEHGQISPSGKKIVWISSQGYPFDDFGSLDPWQLTLKTDWWIMNADGSNKRKLTFFNEPGHPQYTEGERVIAADSSWNKDGTTLLATLGVIAGSDFASRIVLIEFTEPQ